MSVILDAVSKGQSSSPAAPEREQQQQEGDDTGGPSLRHLLDESKESLIEAERAFLSKALALLQVRHPLLPILQSQLSHPRAAVVSVWLWVVHMLASAEESLLENCRASTQSLLGLHHCWAVP